MARKSRKSGSLSIASRLFSPFRRALQATGNSVRTVGRTAGNVAGKVVGTVGKVGQTYAKATNNALSNITRGRKNKRNGSMRSRKGTRRAHGTRRGNRR